MGIYEKLKEYEKSNQYPFHMPGHKGSMGPDFAGAKSLCPEFPYGMDITEIEGYDDLHHPEGMLKEAQDYAAYVYGAKQCYYLVNGSTCGILTAVSAAVPYGGTILVARNCHKAVYHAIQLRGARAVYLYPRVDAYGIAEAITAEQVKMALKKAEEDGIRFDAVLLTSPTYEGRCSALAEIAGILHERDIPLIVDAAHGAHFGMGPGFPENAVSSGADLVIESIHKTLPAPTQTALLFRCSDRICGEKLESYLDIYETSSPSYVLMAAMEKAIAYAAERKEAWQAYAKRLSSFYEKVKDCKAPGVLRTDDPGKIILLGQGLAEPLLRDYGIMVEMESLNYCILMTGLFDTDEGFDRLARAILDLNRKNIGMQEPVFNQALSIEPKVNCRIAEAVEAGMDECKLAESCDRIAGEFVYVYPPGIPVLVPGEIISQEAVSYLMTCEKNKISVKGNAKTGWIRVLSEQ